LKSLGAGLRAVIVTGPVDNASLADTRLALSTPVVTSFTHPLVCGAVFASHPLDLQTFADTSTGPNLAHVGPPAVNIEAKLISVNEVAMERGDNPTGELLVQGPSVGLPVPVPEIETQETWVRTGYGAIVQSNGTFKIAAP